MSLTPEQQQQLAAGVASGQIKIAPKKSKPSGDKPVTMEELNKGTMSNRKFVNLSLLCLILSIFAGTYQFTMGFFPINPHTTEINLPSDVPDAPEAKFNKLVFVVIDALRSDFVSSPNSNFTMTKNKIMNGNGMFFESMAEAPTVTLPRIKSLVSGSVPTFFDFVMNFGASKMTAPNIIEDLAENKNKKVVFYGDETWIKLFPDTFTRSEGTSSFFVSDTVTVDNNVTRNVEKELGDMGSWDVMILHYLGIDHIGHTQGPKGSLMGPKQGEYDAIIDRIYTQVAQYDASTPGSSTLLVITGDHGMSVTGNHGGSSHNERSTGLIFLSPQYAFSKKSHDEAFKKAKTVHQVDICPTVSTLMGLSVPSQSTGTVIPDVIFDSNSNKDEYTKLLYRTVCQLKATGDSIGIRGVKKAYKDATTAYTEFKSEKVKRSEANSAMEAFIKTASEKLSSKWGGIDWYRAFTGLLVVCLAVLGAVFVIFALYSSEYLTARRAKVMEVFLTIVVTFLGTTSAHILLCLSGDNKTQLPTCSADMSNKVEIGVFCLAIGLSFIPLYGTRFIRTFVMKVQNTGGANSLDALLGISKASKASKEKEKFQYVAPPVPEYIDTILCFLFTIAHCLSYFSSSLIEEEQQTFYFVVTTASLVHLGYSFFWNPNSATKNKKGPIVKMIIMIVMLCVIRVWNSTGARGTPLHGDIAGFFSDNFVYGDIVAKVGCVVSVVVLAWYTHRMLGYDNKVYLKKGRILFEIFTFAAYALVIVYKFPLIQYISFINEIVCARIIFGLVAAALLVGMFWPCVPGTSAGRDNSDTAHLSALLCFLSIVPALLLLNKKHNMVLIALLIIFAHNFIDYCADVDDGFCRPKIAYYRTSFMVWLSKMTFFAMGNSNSVASIDISGSYIGLSSYSPIPVGIETFVVMYTGPIIIFAYCVLMLYRMAKEQKLRAAIAFEQVATVAAITYITNHVALPLMFAIVDLILQYNHLFIWSVFAPKFVYAVIDIAFGAIVVIVLAIYSYVNRLHLIRYERAERATLAKLKKNK